jgi:hypothetical protein
VWLEYFRICYLSRQSGLGYATIRIGSNEIYDTRYMLVYIILFYEIGTYYAARQKISIHDAKGRIWTKIAVLLQKANAYAIQMRIPFDYL